tara:strand:+ start:5157 stop:5396 length:240 start_codon:yes stop_codon:yes gene_type:complete
MLALACVLIQKDVPVFSYLDNNAITHDLAVGGAVLYIITCLDFFHKAHPIFFFELLCETLHAKNLPSVFGDAHGALDYE